MGKLLHLGRCLADPRGLFSISKDQPAVAPPDSRQGTEQTHGRRPDAKMLVDPEWQAAFSKAVAEGIDQYLSENSQS